MFKFCLNAPAAYLLFAALALGQSTSSQADMSPPITASPGPISPSTSTITPTSSTSSSTTSPSPSTGLNTSSLVVNALIGQNNVSTFQCWKIHPDFLVSQQPGTVGARIQQIGNITGGTVVFFDASNVTFAGLHSAPAPQWVVFLSGGGIVRTPADGQTLLINTGDIIIANDTSAVSPIGHDSTWLPGTVSIQLPFANGQVNHTVVNEGPCVSA